MQITQYQRKPRLRENSLQKWFAKECVTKRRRWERTVAAELATRKAARAEDSPLTKNEERLLREEIEKFIAENAAGDLTHLDQEILSMMTRTAVLFTATAAVPVFSTNVLENGTLVADVTLTFVWLSAALGFIASLWPLAPPFWRAWRDPYEKREDWTRLATSHFKRWVRDCWLSDRRTPVITRYKRSHSVVVRLLGVAACGLTLGYLLSILLPHVG